MAKDKDEVKIQISSHAAHKLLKVHRELHIPKLM